MFKINLTVMFTGYDWLSTDFCSIQISVPVCCQKNSLIVCKQNEFGVWEIFLPNNADGSPPIPHGSRVKVTFSPNESSLKDFGDLILVSVLIAA